jgi:arginine:pyruvate transaminase
MKYASLVDRINPGVNPSDPDPWLVHELAQKRYDNGEEIVFLSIGQEADEFTPPVVVDAAIRSLKDGQHHYSQVNGTDSLRSAVVNYHAQLTGQQADIDQCTIFAGAQNALYSIAQVLLEAGDHVIMLEPYYTTYKATFTASGAGLIEVPLLSKHNYQMQIEHVLNAITPDTKLIVLNSPNNPMGQSYSIEDYQRLIDECIEKQIWMLIDAVYMDIVDPALINHPQHLPGAEQVLITVGSLSKSHRMTGWRMGWAIGPTTLAEHLANLSMCMHYGLPPFVMDAATVAIEQSTQTPAVVRELLNKRRKIALTELTELSPAKLHDTGMGMFIILDIAPLGVTALDFALQLLEEHNVSVLPCIGFGPTGKYLVRIGLCVDDDKLATACKKIKRFVRSQV